MYESNVWRKLKSPALTFAIIAVMGQWGTVARLLGAPELPTMLLGSALNTWLLFRYGEV